MKDFLPLENCKSNSPSLKTSNVVEMLGGILRAQFAFDDWAPDHIHFEHGLSLSIYSDGSIVGVAGHLANHRREFGGYRFMMIYQLKSSQGVLIQAGSITLADLAMDQIQDNVVHTIYNSWIPVHELEVDWSKSLANLRYEGHS
jgi:hypothetical protein